MIRRMFLATLAATPLSFLIKTKKVEAKPVTDYVLLDELKHGEPTHLINIKEHSCGMIIVEQCCAKNGSWLEGVRRITARIDTGDGSIIDGPSPGYEITTIVGRTDIKEEDMTFVLESVSYTGWKYYPEQEYNYSFVPNGKVGPWRKLEINSVLV